MLASANNVLPYVLRLQRYPPASGAERKDYCYFANRRRAGRSRAWSFEHGLDPDKDVTYLAVGELMSRLAALTRFTPRHLQTVVPVAEERGLTIMQLEPIPLIIDALWTSRKFADENPQVVQNVLRSYIWAIATLVKDRDKSVETMRKYMRTADSRMVQNAYERYKEELTGCRYLRKRRLKILWR